VSASNITALAGRPRACARGCNLSPLRGWLRADCQVPTAIF